MGKGTKQENCNKTESGERILTPEEIKVQIERERKWLNDNNAISAVTGGPVEDQEGVPLPADIHQGRPPAHSAGEDARPCSEDGG